MRAPGGLVMIVLAAAGLAGTPACNAGNNKCAGDASCATTADAQTGTVTVAWVLRRSDGTSTDCIEADTTNLAINVRDAGGGVVWTSTFYCVDMAKSFDVPPGSYTIELVLYRNRDRSPSAQVSAPVVVEAGATANVGALLLLPQNP
jgi:hypothetical protein